MPNPLFVCSKELVGQVAHWAVRQSPYPVPMGLEAALSAFATAIEPEFVICRTGHCDGWRYFADSREIEDFLRRTLLPIPYVAAWNERRNGRDGMGFSSRYTITPADDDFVDLDALVMSVARGIAGEVERDAVIDQQIVGRFDPDGPPSSTEEPVPEFLRTRDDPC